MLKKLNKKTKYTILYLLSFALIILYLYLYRNDNIKEFLLKADRFKTDVGLLFYFIYFAIKNTSLIAGTLISTIT